MLQPLGHSRCATLPAADAAALRAQFASERLAAGSAREAYDRGLDQVRTLLRAVPLDLSALRAAMADARAARLALDQVLQGVIAAIIPKMSPEGRGPLAEPPTTQRQTVRNDPAPAAATTRSIAMRVLPNILINLILGVPIITAAAMLSAQQEEGPQVGMHRAEVQSLQTEQSQNHAYQRRGDMGGPVPVL